LVERGVVAGHSVVSVGRPELDLAGSTESISNALRATKPDIVISAAAYTGVDKAESERGLARQVNVEGVRAVARTARELNVPLVHLSTDYVFDGRKTSPYLETDATGPTGVYGETKLQGEVAALAEQPNCAILRTAWIYSPFGANFVKTMLRLAADRSEIGVVADQRGNPTSALDIADGILAVALNLVSSDESQLRGVFHMAAAGEATWADFAEAIFAASADARGPEAAVRGINTSDYPTPAKRPANSRLDSSKLERVHAIRLPDWRESLPPVVRRRVGIQDGGMVS
jgi:dTDP-4-dehydrorhamnose reductase